MPNNTMLHMAAKFYLGLREQTSDEAAFQHTCQQFGIWDRTALREAIAGLNTIEGR
jgi:hypothetical protein